MHQHVIGIPYRREVLIEPGNCEVSCRFAVHRVRITDRESGDISLRINGGGSMGGIHSDARVGGQQLRYIPTEKYLSHFRNGCGWWKS